MKLISSRPFAVALALAAAAVVFGADTTPKKKGAAPASAKPAAPAPAKGAAPAAADAKPAAAPAAKADDNEVLAIVDGAEIKRGEVNKEIGEAMAAQGMPPGALPESQRDEATRQILDNLVMEKLITKATAGITVTDADVNGEIAKIKEGNKLDDAGVAAKLKENGKTLDDLKKDIRLGLTQRKWFEAQTKGKITEPSEADAKKFYDANAHDFESPELLRASHILFTLAPDATPDKVIEVEKKAQAAADRAQKEDFAKLAAELTEEPGGKERGGDLDFFSRQQMVPEFSDAAFKLKPGEVTKAPVRSKFGYHIIKATDHKDASKQAFAEVKKDITDFLTREQRQKAVSELMNDLKAKAKIEIKLPPPPPAPAGGQIPPEILEQLRKAQEGAQNEKPEAAPAAPAKPVEAVTPPVTVPPAKK